MIVFLSRISIFAQLSWGHNSLCNMHFVSNYVYKSPIICVNSFKVNIGLLTLKLRVCEFHGSTTVQFTISVWSIIQYHNSLQVYIIMSKLFQLTHLILFFHYLFQKPPFAFNFSFNFLYLFFYYHCNFIANTSTIYMFNIKSLNWY